MTTLQKGLDPNKKIVNLRGKPFPKTFPTPEEMNILPKNDFGQPDRTKLEEETMGNIILNCLGNYIVRDKRNGFYVNTIAQSIVSAISDKKKIDFKDKIRKFLIEVLDDQTMVMETVETGKGKEKEEEEVTKGLYAAWAIAQIKQELGIKED